MAVVRANLGWALGLLVACGGGTDADGETGTTTADTSADASTEGGESQGDGSTQTSSDDADTSESGTESESSTTGDDGDTDTTETTSADPVDPLDGAGVAELVGGGYQFVEGPRWYPDEGVLRFSDIPANTIHRLVPPDDLAPDISDSGNANGLGRTGDGEILACQHGPRRIARRDGGAWTPVVDGFEGNRFNSPNDIAVHSNGTIYFTDPEWGIIGDLSQRELDFNGVFRLDPQDQLSVVTSWPWMGHGNTARPNGVVLSADETRLYVADDLGATIWVMDVDRSGATGERSEFVSTSPVSDGMCMDVHGNLYVTTSAGVEVFAPDGTMWGTITVPEAPANCTFGGAALDVLYLTAQTSLYRVAMPVEGVP